MLRANVGLVRKTSGDPDSRGFTLNLEGEILATLDDPEAVIERIRELYSVAEEALDRQVSESREIDRIASRDGVGSSQPTGDGRPADLANGEASGDRRREASTADAGPATGKQVRFLAALAGRRRLEGSDLEGFIEGVVGRRRPPGDLTRREAGAVIDALNPEKSGADRSRR